MVSVWQFVFLLLPVAVIAEDLHLKYYTDATMECDEIAHNISTSSPIVRKYWLFPKGQLYESTANSTRHLVFDGANGTLTVKRIDDDDFGKYYCIIVHGDNSLSRISHGLNLNGAYFGNLLELYKQKAMVGGIAAGILFAIISSFCICYQLRYRRRSQRNNAVDELDKAIDGYDLKAYDNVAVDAADTQVEQDDRADGVTDLDQKM